MDNINQNEEPGPPLEAALFQAAVQLEGAARASFLDNVCRGDAALRQRLESLLAAHEQPEGVLAEPAASAKATLKLELADIPDETVGQKIGRYKILEKIGEGGCGVVYVAEQTEPVRRRVALKVIKLGMDTRQVVARFEAERQALAMMDHPNIAKVLDAGTTETGRPYFIMELVRGIRITDYCDQNNLSTGERLDLFIKVCQAIQHAHQKGIIHRDIKPSNILVTLHDGVPVPKVIDFGIAKATTDQRLTDKTIYTQLQQFVGTPAYMSPEQAEMSGLDIDTRSDIYSLGVLLYELLTGRTPFDANELMSQGIDAMRKTIREQDPLRPSTKLATLKGEELTTTAKRRSVDRSKLLHQLQGDLDWIVMKCLEKDRTRRYETANGLAMDLKRHLNNETVVARPPSKLYEFQKTVRRHKVGFAATAAVMIALAAGIVIATWQAVRATRAKHEALAAQALAVTAQASEKTQRQQAVVNEQKAIAAQQAEAKEALAARQRAYASDMNVAAQLLAEGTRGRVLDLLNRQRPKPGERDLRGWEWRYLWGQTRSEASFTLCQEPAEINALVASPDGNWLAVGAYHKGGLGLWDLRTHDEVARLAKDESYIRAAFSPVEPLLAFASTAVSGTGERRPVLRLWNTMARQTVAEWPLEDSFCMGIAFAEDGKTLSVATAQASPKGHIEVLRISDGTKLASYATDLASTLPATSFAATPDLKVAAYGCGFPTPQRIRLVNLNNGRELWNAQAAEVFVTALAFSPDARILATGAGFAEPDIRLWDVASSKEIGRLQGHNGWVSSLVFSKDGKTLYSTSADQTIRIWDVASQKCLEVLRGHRQEVWRLALLPDNKMLASGSKDGSVYFWNTTAVRPTESSFTISDQVVSWCFEPDGRSVLTLNQQGEVKRWSGPGFSQVEKLFEAGKLLSAPVTAHRLCRGGQVLMAVSDERVLRAWDVTRKSLVGQWPPAADAEFPLGFRPAGNSIFTYTVSKGIETTLRERDFATGQEIQTWQLGGRFQEAFGISPDGKSCVTINYDGEGSLRNLARQSSDSLSLDILEAASVSFSPDGKLLVAGSDLALARVWQTATWQPVTTLSGFVWAAHSVVFSPTGRRLAIGGGKKEAVKLFDTESWQQVFTLEGRNFDFHGLAFSPDESAIGWLNMDGQLQIWRAPSWDEIHAAEAKDLPSQDYGVTGKIETQRP